MFEIQQGSTEQVEIIVDEDVSAYKCSVHFGEIGNPRLVVSGEAVSMNRSEGKTRITVNITQAETFRLTAGKVLMQLRAVSPSGAAIAWPVVTGKVLPTISGGVVAYE